MNSHRDFIYIPTNWFACQSRGQLHKLYFKTSLGLRLYLNSQVRFVVRLTLTDLK